jgi:hypothetical protein
MPLLPASKSQHIRGFGHDLAVLLCLALDEEAGSMTSDFHQASPAALTAVRLRRRLRALAAGQTEAFDLLHRQFGDDSTLGTTIGHATNRLPYLAALLADVAWTQGEHAAAHDGVLPPPAPEAEAVKRVFRCHTNVRLRAMMNREQRTAVLAYLDALLVEVASCLELDQHAPSATLGREARRFLGDFTEVREATAAR